MPAPRRTPRTAPILLGAAVVLAFWTATSSAQVPELPLPTPTSVPSVIGLPETGLDLPVHVTAPETGGLVDGDPVGDKAETIVPRSSYKEWTRTDGGRASEGTAGARTPPASAATRAGDARDASDTPSGRSADPYGTAVAGSVVDTFRRAVSLAEPAALPLSLSVIALLLLGIAARGPGRLGKLEDDAEVDRCVFRL